VCDVVLPRIAADGLADAVDVFCDAIAFSPSEAERVFEAAKKAGLPVKMHADQLTDCGGAELAARYRALSADHLEFASARGIEALAAAGTVAIALASDCNPGTSPVTSLLAVMNMACVLFGFSPHEALLATTRNAARALGLVDRGELRVGLRCDLALWNVASPVELCYWVGRPLCAGVVVGGVVHS
jgi:imidazolonepropionase